MIHSERANTAQPREISSGYCDKQSVQGLKPIAVQHNVKIILGAARELRIVEFVHFRKLAEIFR